MKFKIKDRPINILIFVDVVIHHIGYSVAITIVMSWLLTDSIAGRPFESLTGIQIGDDAFCRFVLYQGTFIFHYDAIGSFGVCLFRFSFFEFGFCILFPLK